MGPATVSSSVSTPSSGAALDKNRYVTPATPRVRALWEFSSGRVEEKGKRQKKDARRGRGRGSTED